jgi:hypothetical protein
VLWNVGTGTQGTETFCLRKWLYMQVWYISEWFLRVSVTIYCCGTGTIGTEADPLQSHVPRHLPQEVALHAGEV